MKKSILIFAACLLTHFSFSQTAILRTNPPSVKWDQIKTPYFRIIYDSKYEKQAQKTANILETVYEPAAITLGEFPKRTTIILQNQTAISNAFVAMAPRRAEFNTYPTQRYFFSGNNGWMELLSIHEYRHIVQYEKSLTGFTRVMYYLFGQATASGFANIAVPDWFWEGDAVVTETALTHSGRGRIPHFSMAFRANLATYGPYSYNKQYLKSYKDFVPNHYVTGYFFSTYLRKEYGVDVLDKATQMAWNWSFVPFTFSNSLKKNTGKYLVKNYRSFIGELEQKWEDQRELLNAVSYEAINSRKNDVYTNYSFPHLLADGSVLALKEGLGDIETFVKIKPDGSQEKVFVPGFINPSARISTNGEVIVWNELIPDVRWEARIFSDIKLYDLASETEKRITRRQRFSSAAISPNGSKIATVETDEAGENSLVALDTSGREIARFSDPGNALYINPDWDPAGEKIVAVKLSDRQKSVVLVDPEKSTEEVLFEAGEENIGYPKLYDQYLFYSSSYNGIGNIYLMERETGRHYQVTNSEFGAYNPHYNPASNTLYFNEYNAHGFDIAKMKVNVDRLEQKANAKIYRDEWVETISRQENNDRVLENVTEHQFPIEDYSELAGIINPHSWGVTYGSTIDEYHFFIASQDVINTTQINAGYTYNLNENAGRWQVNASYQGLFPIIDLNVFQGERAIVEEIQGNAYGFYWDESGVELGVRLPFNFTNDKYGEFLTLGGSASLYSVDDYPGRFRYDTSLYRNNGNLRALELRATYGRLLKTSPKDIYSRWGQQLRLFLYSTPFAGDFQGMLFAAEGTLFFPGLFKHHSLLLRGGYQREDRQNYTFRSPLIFPRGHSYTAFDRFHSFSANYALPLLYPDLGLGPVLYIARIRANLFYDFGYGERDAFNALLDVQKDYHTLGADLVFDFNIMRFLPRLSAGVRAVYLPEENDYSLNIVLGSLGF